MIHSYLLVMLRTLWRDRGYTLINVLGLSIGIAVCILISLYIKDELTFDMMHEKADRMYRAVEVRNSPEEGTQYIGSVMGPVGPALSASIPQVEQTVRLLTRQNVGRLAVGMGPNRIYDGNFVISDPNFFEVFDFRLLAGDPTTALVEPRSVVLTESEARRHFGEENPVGRDLYVERWESMKVTGVMEDLPPNSHLSFSMIISMASVTSHPGWNRWIQSRKSEGFFTYVVLEEGTTPQEIAGPLKQVAATYADTQATAVRSFMLQPLSDVHFGSMDIAFDRNEGKGNSGTLWIFAAIGLFVIAIASVNYTNLATARSLKRAREVGIRKVAGADRRQLFRQFLGESFLLTGFAFLAALLLQELFLPVLNTLSGKSLSFSVLEHPDILGSMVLLGIIVAMVAGWYPAAVLSRLSPSRVLKGSLWSTKEGQRLRRGLVTFQFVLSVAMIICTLVVHEQLGFVNSKDLGFRKTGMIVVDINSGNTRSNFQTIKNEFSRVPGVKSVSSTSRVPGEWKNLPEIEIVAADGNRSTPLTASFFAVDEDFLSTYEIPLVDGRNLSPDLRTDSLSVLVNESAAKLLGGAGVLGGEIVIQNALFAGQREPLGMRVRVVGVVDDFHFRSLFEPIRPAIFGYWSNPIQAIDYFTVNVQGTSVTEVVDGLRPIALRFDPEHPFEFNILEDRWADFYTQEERVSRIFTSASALSITIACLGLFGLAAFSTEQRTKEVGIRKVLGATPAGIVGHLSKEFMLLVLVGNAIAWPLSYLAMSKWLENFSYRMDLGISIFLAAGILSVAIAFLSVAYRAVKAALSNPVEALRYE